MDEHDMFSARCDTNISDLERRRLIFDELKIILIETDNKSIETQYKANAYRFINNLSVFIIIACAGIIVGLQAASECINIPAIVLASVIFILQGIQPIFRLAQQGFSYEQGTISLRRIKRQVRNIMYMYHTFTVEQVIAKLSKLMASFDKVDLGLFKTSISQQTKYDTGLVIPDSNEPQNNLQNQPSSPHVHIHIDDSHYSPSVEHIDSTEIKNEEIYENDKFIDNV